ncbi:MAG TPA: hypothetical protein VGM90_26600 [Kofleriaceae bacterium]|jgi:hypothetical protein
MRALGWLAIAAFTLPGCSYVLMDRAPRAVRRTDVFPGCTSENKWAYADVGLTGLAAVSAILFISGAAKVDDMSAPGGKRELTDGERVFGSIGAIVDAGIFALSAKYGFETTSTCREMQAKQPPLPPYGYPPPGYAPYPAPQLYPYPPPQPYPQPAPPTGGAQ